jgi:hypothetical protein
MINFKTLEDAFSSDKIKELLNNYRKNQPKWLVGHKWDLYQKSFNAFGRLNLPTCVFRQ